MDDSTPEAALEKMYRMHLLSKEFTEKAVKLGKTIIEEVDKPADQKTIKPKNMGGVAGGEKYSEQGIFFKFAIDLFKIYGGDEFAIKAAGLELQGLKCLLQTGIKGLHYPLMILIDYRGYRLIGKRASESHSKLTCTLQLQACFRLTPIRWFTAVVTVPKALKRKIRRLANWWSKLVQS